MHPRDAVAIESLEHELEGEVVSPELQVRAISWVCVRDLRIDGLQLATILPARLAGSASASTNSSHLRPQLRRELVLPDQQASRLVPFAATHRDRGFDAGLALLLETEFGASRANRSAWSSSPCIR